MRHYNRTLQPYLSSPDLEPGQAPGTCALVLFPPVQGFFFFFTEVPFASVPVADGEFQLLMT